MTRPETPKGEGKMAKFWKNEGERSGLGNSHNRVGNFFSRLNPFPALKDQERRYEERKTQSAK